MCRISSGEKRKMPYWDETQTHFHQLLNLWYWGHCSSLPLCPLGSLFDLTPKSKGGWIIETCHCVANIMKLLRVSFNFPTKILYWCSNTEMSWGWTQMLMGSFIAAVPGCVAIILIWYNAVLASAWRERWRYYHRLLNQPAIFVYTSRFITRLLLCADYTALQN